MQSSGVFPPIPPFWSSSLGPGAFLQPPRYGWQRGAEVASSRDPRSVCLCSAQMAGAGRASRILRLSSIPPTLVPVTLPAHPTSVGSCGFYGLYPLWNFEGQLGFMEDGRRWHESKAWLGGLVTRVRLWIAYRIPAAHPIGIADNSRSCLVKGGVCTLQHDEKGWTAGACLRGTLWVPGTCIKRSEKACLRSPAVRPRWSFLGPRRRVFMVHTAQRCSAPRGSVPGLLEAARRCLTVGLLPPRSSARRSWAAERKRLMNFSLRFPWLSI